jgi:organic hydroperoxide reductase OsmC/OhrA
MSDHHAAVRWTRSSADFTYDSYNRAHVVSFKQGAITIDGSASPAFRGDADRVDPEEAYVASLSACHMLSFLAICARKRLTVDAYEDDAVGTMEKGANGKFWVSRVMLHPRVSFAPGTVMNPATLAEIHHQSHVECFIANSVKTDVSVAQHS